MHPSFKSIELMRLIVKVKKDTRLLSIPNTVIQKKNKSALQPVPVEIPDPIQGIWGSENSSAQNDFHLVCIFLLYSEPGSIASALKDDLLSRAVLRAPGDVKADAEKHLITC